MLSSFSGFSLNTLLEAVSSPTFQSFQLVAFIYGGLLWLSIIIWVTRDAIHRSESLLFQVFSIFLNIIFPVLGILLYLIIRPSKTITERYYEELEHRLILESVEAKERAEAQKTVQRPPKKTAKKQPANPPTAPNNP